MTVPTIAAKNFKTVVTYDTPPKTAIAKGATPIIGVTRSQHIDGLIRASNLTLAHVDIVELEAVADEVGVSTRGWWEREMVV